MDENKLLTVTPDHPQGFRIGGFQTMEEASEFIRLARLGLQFEAVSKKPRFTIERSSFCR